jgi:hypothetical protein
MNIAGSKTFSQRICNNPQKEQKTPPTTNDGGWRRDDTLSNIGIQQLISEQYDEDNTEIDSEHDYNLYQPGTYLNLILLLRDFILSCCFRVRTVV